MFAVISRLFKTKRGPGEKFRSKMDLINAEMERLALSSELQDKIKNYYQYLWLHHGGELLGSASVLRDPDLSAILRREVSLELATHTVPLRTLPLFKGISDECVAAAVLQMRTHVFMPGDYLCLKGDVVRELFYVSKGYALTSSADPDSEGFEDVPPLLNIEVRAGKKVGHWRIAGEGQFFGDNEIGFKNRTYPVTVRAYRAPVELSVLSKIELLSIFDDYQEIPPNFDALDSGSDSDNDEQTDNDNEKQGTVNPVEKAVSDDEAKGASDKEAAETTGEAPAGAPMPVPAPAPRASRSRGKSPGRGGVAVGGVSAVASAVGKAGDSSARSFGGLSTGFGRGFASKPVKIVNRPSTANGPGLASCDIEAIVRSVVSSELSSRRKVEQRMHALEEQLEKMQKQVAELTQTLTTKLPAITAAIQKDKQ
jgi:hypothetical protein